VRHCGACVIATLNGFCVFVEFFVPLYEDFVVSHRGVARTDSESAVFAVEQANSSMVQRVYAVYESLCHQLGDIIGKVHKPNIGEIEVQ